MLRFPRSSVSGSQASANRCNPDASTLSTVTPVQLARSYAQLVAMCMVCTNENRKENTTPFGSV